VKKQPESLSDSGEGSDDRDAKRVLLMVMSKQMIKEKNWIGLQRSRSGS
jgi:hypothetical protein